ncbi:pantoate--beta-alanine ligase [Helicobacter cholecystus]|uniref:pantoate--beta-alanine ligase n=1 Tax=Helicobacter cholecystus TaxID=45498 RepID=UPI00273924DD|nr:pantoate--beta-alanine ligase [Helicobacter cholecystus]
MKSPIILKTTQELLDWRKEIKNSLGFVPTMGALHAGHLSLLEASITKNSHTLLSIFVNPTQFGANEDFDKYPRTLQTDIMLAKGVDAIFAPEISEIYCGDEETTLNPPKSMANVYEGFHRRGHFEGVLQIVLKLFNLIRPNYAYFGQKDAQQLLILQKMVKDFFLPLEIIPCPIVRDYDGLALSSRNIYLSKNERALALKIPQTLQKISSLISQGEDDVQTLYHVGISELEGIEVDYLAFCDHSLKPLKQILPSQTLVLLTCKVGNTRLLDNLWI